MAVRPASTIASAELDWRSRRVDVGRVALHCVEAGAGPLVVLLHGFPELWYSWRFQIGPLAAAGYRVVAPDLRGYGGSDRPEGVRSYFLPELMGDVVGLIRALGESRATVVGHDWGGIIAFFLGMHHANALAGLVVLNGVHPGPYLRAIKRPDQRLRSWYVPFFRLPRLPELLLSARGLRAIDRLFRTEPARPGAFTREDVEIYKRALGVKGALTAAIDYYRALFVSPNAELVRRVEPSDVPTLVIWGDRDTHLNLDVVAGLDEWITDVRVEHLADASHWVQHDEPQRVNELILAFLSRGPSAR